ncbi:MAG: S9 family peptidase [Candidatus Latescibacterota bacterium]
MKTICFVTVLTALITAFTIQSYPAARAEEDTDTTLTVERIYSDESLSSTLPSNIQWLPGGEALSYFAERSVDDEDKTVFIICHVPSGKERIVCIPDTFAVAEDLKTNDEQTFRIGSYIWSEQSATIVFCYEGDVFTLDTESAVLHRHTQSKGTEDNVTFSPDGNMLAYTRGNDLYFMDGGEETRITSTGADTLYNGVLNWVYMEELFTRGNTQAYWWAPDGSAIAFMEIRDGHVPEFPIVDPVPTHGSVEMQRYPKAGDPNPDVRIGVYDIGEDKIYWGAPVTGEDGYIARVYWLSDSKRLAIEKLNRDQNSLTLLFTNYASGRSETILHETDSTWVTVDDIKHYYDTKPRFAWASERSGRSHIYLYGLDGGLIRQISKGPWDVRSLDGVDEERGDIYFTATRESPLERHLYRINEKGEELHRLTRRAGSHRAVLSPNHRYYLDYYSSIDTPTELAVHDADGKHLFTLSTAPEEAAFLKTLPKPEFVTVTSDEGLSFQCQIIKPGRFDKHKKYPVIIYTYGGPSSQVVSNRWGGAFYLWQAMMADRGYILFSLDNRGTFGKGRKWINPVYKRLGEIELRDQLSGVDYLKSLPYVDPARIGIWGWSYGGFMTCLALCKAPDVFKAGVAVAPVVDFRLYDSIYTERFMKRPQDNEKGYDDNAPLNFVEDIASPLLLVHGFVDDNVHMQNTLVFADSLIEHGKDFDLMLYPGKEHSIRGDKARTHLFNKITAFFEENL